jgi:multimeric flavodoxin WrbA
MSARLKDFLDRTTCLENLPLLGEKSQTAGKIAGILITGHEDGALKTAMDIFVYLQQMGYILAPFGFTYRTHGAGNDAKTDNKFVKVDKKLEKEVRKVVSNVAETMRMGLETKLRDRIKPVCE